jgi:hypothetical protein
VTAVDKCVAMCFVAPLSSFCTALRIVLHI